MNRVKRMLMVGIVMLLSISAIPCTAQDDPVASNRAVAERWMEIWQQADWDALEGILAPDVVMHNPFLPTPMEGYDATQSWVASIGTAFEDMDFTIEHLVANEDYAAVHFSAEAVFANDYDLMGVPATGEPVKWSEIDVLRIEDGQIVEFWMGYDTLHMAQEMGIAPPAEDATGDTTPTDADTSAPGAGDPDANIALVEQFHTAVLNNQNIDLIPELFSENFVLHDRADSRDVSYEGIAGVEAWVQPYFVMVPDLTFAIDEGLMVAEGDLVVFQWVGYGTHSGDVPDIPASGNEIAVSGISLYRLEDGKIAETWFAMDTLSFLTQIEVIPPAE
ncbi:MAG: ester cyclase [Chloroflexi bacterium]|nr:ester cyclase [Chloroflexota bacterium]